MSAAMQVTTAPLARFAKLDKHFGGHLVKLVGLQSPGECVQERFLPAPHACWLSCMGLR